MSRRAPGGQAASRVARYSAWAEDTAGPSPARISWGRGAGGSTSRENGASRAMHSAHRVSRLGLPIPASSWDSVDLDRPAFRAISLRLRPVRRRSRRSEAAITAMEALACASGVVIGSLHRPCVRLDERLGFVSL